MASRTAARLKEFEAELDKSSLDFKRIRKLCHAGIPDKPGTRALFWKLLLNYLPARKSEWESELQKQRQLYMDFVKDFIDDTHKDTNTSDEAGDEVLVDPLGALSMENSEDEGSSSSPMSPTSQKGKWDVYFKDNLVIEQIDKDVKRLCPEFAFFQGLTHIPKDPGLARLHHRVERRMLDSETISTSRAGVAQITRKTSTEFDVMVKDNEEYHWEVIERILFIYAKLNPGIGYVQGMNEIIGPLYYIMASNPDETWRKHCEPDTYWCFMLLLSEFRDNFIKTLDNSDMGISSLLNKLSKIISTHDTELHLNLEEKGIKPMFYGFRWLTCLISQEFPLPDVIRLWDSLFSKQDRQAYLLCMCASMLVCVKDQILEGSFADNVKLLQNLPLLEAHQILSKADGISVKLGYEDSFQAFLSS
eukprot:m.28915 g.28915  ORF g.28915 m.28915 type:complete len:418 (+) comp8044_c0_seq1:216-1469(+)